MLFICQEAGTSPGRTARRRQRESAAWICTAHAPQWCWLLLSSSPAHTPKFRLLSTSQGKLSATLHLDVPHEPHAAAGGALGGDWIVRTLWPTGCHERGLAEEGPLWCDPEGPSPSCFWLDHASGAPPVSALLCRVPHFGAGPLRASADCAAFSFKSQVSR